MFRTLRVRQIERSHELEAAAGGGGEDLAAELRCTTGANGIPIVLLPLAKA
jgi:hypothetical protein